MATKKLSVTEAEKKTERKFVELEVKDLPKAEKLVVQAITDVGMVEHRVLDFAGGDFRMTFPADESVETFRVFSEEEKNGETKRTALAKS